MKPTTTGTLASGTSRPSRLARHLVPPSGEDVTIVQGTIVDWDPATFANVVDIDGQEFLDVPVASGVEALTYQQGDVVLVEKWFPGGRKGELGLGTAWIRGRIITPGTGAAEQAIAFMQTGLAGAIQRDIIAGGIRADTNAGQTTTTSTTFGVGSNAGPTLTDVVVSELGLCLVIWGAGTDAGPVTGGQVGGHMGLLISGATSISPSTATAAHVGQSVTVTSGTVTHRSQARTLAAQVLTLNPGSHTISARYASQVSGATASFTGRTIIAIPF